MEIDKGVPPQRPAIPAELIEPHSSNWPVTITLTVVINVFVAVALALFALLAKEKGIGEIAFYGFMLGILALIALGIFIPYRYHKLLKSKNQLAHLLTACENRYGQQLERIGVTEIAETLKDSQFSPDAVMVRAQHEVRFVGVFGHKWVMDAGRKQKFRDMLRRVQLNGGKVQFLLLNPNCNAARKLAGLRDQEPNTYKDFDSVKHYVDLSKEFDCFDLKLFEHFPFIRLIFVDGHCAISRFKVSAQADVTMEAPQLVFAPENPGGTWTMYQPFVHLYEYIWDHAIDPAIGLAKNSSQSARGGHV